MKISASFFCRAKNALFASVLFVFAAGHGAETKNRTAVPMLPGENWWGLGSNFGREMPFTEKSDFKCDLRNDSYGNQTQSLLVSDKGRVLYCADPVEAKLSGGEITFTPGRDKPVAVEIAGRTLAEAFRHASKKFFPPPGGEPELLYFSAPQYNTWIELTYHQNEKDVLAYAQSMLDHGLPPGIFMIDDTWQHGYGTWEFDARRFGDPKGMVDRLHDMGFKVLLWMCPYVSLDSPAYRLLEFGRSPDTCKRLPTGGFMLEAGNDRAAAVKWWNGRSALVDLSHPNGYKWFTGELDGLCRNYGIDAFKLDNSGVEDFVGLRAYDAALDAAGLNGLYARLALRYPGSECRAVFGLAGQPIIVRLHDKDHSWKALQRLVPDMLAAGMSGYPFVCPDMIGGGSWSAFLPGSPFDAELFVRSAQVHALCPMMQISASPWRVLDKEHQEAFLAAVRLRQKFAPKIVELAKRAAKDGEPIMRNLEYVFPGQGYAEVRDEFMLGDTLLVAPVLEKGVSSRSVLLPPGKWIADDGRRYDGPARIEVSVDLLRLPYFLRVKPPVSGEEERK